MAFDMAVVVGRWAWLHNGAERLQRTLPQRTDGDTLSCIFEPPGLPQCVSTPQGPCGKK